MTKKNSLQISCDTILYERIEKYKEGKSSIASMAHAGRELIEFALMIKERTDGDDSRTNRELMEEILLKQYTNEELIKKTYLTCYQDGQSFPLGLIEMVREQISGSKNNGVIAYEAYMAREKRTKK